MMTIHSTESPPRESFPPALGCYERKLVNKLIEAMWLVGARGVFYYLLVAPDHVANIGVMEPTEITSHKTSHY